MKIMLRIASTAMLAACLALQGCAFESHSADVYSGDQAQREQTVRMGTVVAVRPVTIQSGQANGVGAIGGGALGAVAGSAIGGGRGQLLSSIVGGIAGLAAGHAIEGGLYKRNGLEITVRLDNGALRAVTQQATGEVFRVGERVRLLTSGGITRITH